MTTPDQDTSDAAADSARDSDPSLLDSQPGRRFIDRYERRAQLRREYPNPLMRFGRLALGVVILLAAIPIGAIPGPGGVAVVLAGLYMLAGEVRWIARLLDWGEVRGKPHWEVVKTWWFRPGVRIGRVVLAVLIAVPLGIWLWVSGVHWLVVFWTFLVAFLMLLDVLIHIGRRIGRLGRSAR